MNKCHPDRVDQNTLTALGAVNDSQVLVTADQMQAALSLDQLWDQRGSSGMVAHKAQKAEMKIAPFLPKYRFIGSGGFKISLIWSPHWTR